MGVKYDDGQRIFHLQGKDTSYIFKVTEDGYLVHIYWGKKIRSCDISDLIHVQYRVFSTSTGTRDNNFSLDNIMQEYPSYGNTDLRHPAYQVQLENGSTITDLRYVFHKIYQGKPKLEGLPATYAESESCVDTLEIELYDQVANLKAILTYSVFKDYDVLVRSVKFINEGTQKLKLLCAMSVSVDFDNSNYELMQLSGSWARERYIYKRKLVFGMQGVESIRGASSPQQNPFIALLGEGASETFGDVYGFNLVYSGNFTAQCEVEQYGTARVLMGINPFDFSWLLEGGESFQTPEAVMVYSDKGIEKMSQSYHKFYKNHLIRKREELPPILINNWEATYFDFDDEKIISIAEEASKLGIELFVLDDGWFGERNDDTSSLGDWFVNRNKIKDGLDGLAKRINSFGMKFGLWFEPEMVSPKSKLYKEHPDWCIHVPDRHRSLSRHQLILDLTNKDVCDTVVKMLTDVLSSAPISYVKWDMNRHMTEIGSSFLPKGRQRETAHRYMLGLYDIMERLTSAFPKVLFEGCSSGGGRFDPGILYYMPQIWTSDNTDSVERLKIQYGTSIVYPPSSMGSHVSAVPNHITGRVSSLKMRGDVASSGNLGYELDVGILTDTEKDIICKQIDFYKNIRPLVLFGDFYRLISPFEGNDAAWMFVSEDKDEAVVFYFGILSVPNSSVKRLKLRGLDENADYELVGGNVCYGGDRLMYAGINITNIRGDFSSYVMQFKRCR
ncbi:MAG: alpha-galactosidase [Clostridia bacterium]|nr:alpha-galactosidase [Clostridia bacterium]